MSGRRAALLDLTAQLLAAVLADLSMAPTTAFRWIGEAEGELVPLRSRHGISAPTPTLTKWPATASTTGDSTLLVTAHYQLDRGMRLEAFAALVGHRPMEMILIYARTYRGQGRR
jgi:hypothetical protein